MNLAKKRAIMGIAIGIIALILVSGIVMGIINAKNRNFTSDAGNTPDKNQVNTIGNTTANLMNEGLTTTQGDKIYYINGNSAGEDRLMVVDWDGKNERELCALDGELSELNVIGDQLFFIKIVYDGDPYEGASLISGAVCCFNLSDLSVTELYSSNEFLSSLFVIKEKMYFNAESEGKVYTANLDGSDLACVIEKDDNILNFSIYENYMYYFVGLFNTPLYRCDLDGSNETAFSFISGPTGYYISNLKIYYVASEDDPDASYADTVERPVVYSINSDGTQKKEVLKSKGFHGIGFIDIVDNVLYYYDCTDTYVASEEEDSYHFEIYAKKLNGSSKKIAETDSLITGQAVCGNWLFYYDAGKKEIVKIKL